MNARQRIQLFSEASVVLAAVGTIPLVILEERGQTSPALTIAGWLIWCLFAFDCAFGFYSSKSGGFSIQKHVVDVVVVVLSLPLLPAALALTRLVRIFRLVRLARLAAIAVRVVPAL